MTNRFLESLVLLFTLVGMPQVAGAACDQTLSPGANLAAAIANAPNDSTICLNSGSYGIVSLTNIARTGYVTVQSTTARGASISPRLWNAHYIRLQSLTISDDTNEMGCSTHIQWLNNDFTGRGHTLSNANCTKNLNSLIDGNIFRDYKYPSGWYNAHINVVYGNGVTISNNFIGGSAADGSSDGIQVLGQATNVTIGPGNVFSDIVQSKCPNSHCDSIQLYGAGPNTVITGNYFYNDSVFIMAPDGSDLVVVTNNVFDGSSDTYPGKLQFGSANSPRFEHNTVLGTNVGFSSKTGNPASTNAIVKNNILKNGRFDITYGSGCTSCTFDTNLFYGSSSTLGTNILVGTPTYVGGAAPTSYAGFRLTTSSLGYKAGTDGNDVGVVFSGASTTGPAAPRNVRMN